MTATEQEQQMSKIGEYTPAFLAGFISGRGGSNTDGEKVWLYLWTIDREIASAAREMWGGRNFSEEVTNGAPKHKYVADTPTALAAIKAICPYLVGAKRLWAENILEDCACR